MTRTPRGSCSQHLPCVGLCRWWDQADGKSTHRDQCLLPRAQHNRCERLLGSTRRYPRPPPRRPQTGRRGLPTAPRPRTEHRGRIRRADGRSSRDSRSSGSSTSSCSRCSSTTAVAGPRAVTSWSNPEGNTDIAHANDENRILLADDATFASATIEDLLSAKVLAPRTGAALRRRYLPWPRGVPGPSRRVPRRCAGPEPTASRHRVGLRSMRPSRAVPPPRRLHRGCCDC